MEDSSKAKLAPKIPPIFSNKRVIEVIKKVLHTKPKTRSVSELRRLSNFLEKCNIFKNIKDPVRLRELCNCVRLVECYENEVICKQGDRGTKFYIILSGAVNGFVNKAAGDNLDVDVSKNCQSNGSLSDRQKM